MIHEYSYGGFTTNCGVAKALTELSSQKQSKVLWLLDKSDDLITHKASSYLERTIAILRDRLQIIEKSLFAFL